ncbi:filamentous hemagglutinin N-terminal domain-containing protein [Caldichromatium japonicum]|uniref:Filamentous hemagglutinin N-terminal domain-containing protein n=1 Tax=Caldichromatium japonicum TaxID=2699430 RepID=A0A6G7VEN7_9GAMM|nr:filamentous hemagglutinin N-terminal domain-containing protein [Caldichromatium japonicum]
MIAAALLNALDAQILTDGAVGPMVELSGREMTVGAELGTVRGANLFHSFSRLDIGEGQRATFTGPEHIQNVIGRVTGGRVLKRRWTQKYWAGIRSHIAAREGCIDPDARTSGCAPDRQDACARRSKPPLAEDRNPQPASYSI